jgi:hypothetical protein
MAVDQVSAGIRRFLDGGGLRSGDILRFRPVGYPTPLFEIHAERRESLARIMRERAHAADAARARGD